ncbi:helix-turn-helix domain-containing protein [Oxalobacteraceae bacterium A2-2]
MFIQDGYTACRLLKAHPATQDIPIIFISSNDGDDDRILGLSIGGVDFVSKPFSAGELAARIQVHLGLVRRYDAAADAVTVAAAKRLIVEHLADLPSLAEIARLVGTHREKLSQVFRQQTGATVFAYIREERIRRGEQLLRDTDMEVQDIAMLIGFQNAGNFATAFRARTGVTPSAFRQALQRQPG